MIGNAINKTNKVKKVIPDHFKILFTNDFFVFGVLIDESILLILLNLRENKRKNHSPMLKTIKALSNILVGTCITLNCFSQTDSIKQITPSSSEEKEKFGDEIYAGISHVYGYRSLKVREGLFAQPLGIRENEEAHWTVSFELGYRVKMTERFSLCFGMEFNQIGMQYRTPNDSVFVGYNIVKQGIATPIRTIFQPVTLGSNNDFIIQLGLGVAPKMFIASKYTEIELNNFGQEEETVTIKKNGYNYFNVDALFNAGFRWNISNTIGLYFTPELRYALLDTYDKQRPYIQRNYGLFLRWGLYWQL